MARSSEFEEPATAESRYGRIVLRSTGKRVFLNSREAYYLALELIIALEQTDPEYYRESVEANKESKLRGIIGMG